MCFKPRDLIQNLHQERFIFPLEIRYSQFNFGLIWYLSMVASPLVTVMPIDYGGNAIITMDAS